MLMLIYACLRMYISEYLPYRRNDLTVIRDEKRHPWMCSHGYVIIRVDMRGTGDSDGLYFGEYEPQEQQDCLEVITWIRNQPWSSGNVGRCKIISMYDCMV